MGCTTICSGFWVKNEQKMGLKNAIFVLENLIFCIDIPTIGAVNGPGTHCELATLCDITICTEDADFFDPHYLGGTPPGDGMLLTLQNMIGFKKAAYYAYTGKSINGQTALDLGIVSEVLPREKLLPRAWELAEMIMQAPRSTRHLSHSIISRPWKQALVSDQGFQLAHQMYDMAIDEEGALERLKKMQGRLMGKEV
ncbi:Enoyl-CoA hydratase/isomerase family protein [Paenibacillus macerans]